MGQWGEKSYEGDSCYDTLDMLDIYDDETRTPKKVRKAIQELLDEDYRAKEYIDEQDYVGVLIYLLRHGATIAHKRAMRKAIKFIDEMLGDKAYLDNWKDSDGRKKELLLERADLQSAIENDGNIPRK